MADEKKPRRKSHPPRPIGRPPLPGPPRRDVKLYLPDAAMVRLRVIGRGSASEGVLQLLALYEEDAAA